MGATLQASDEDRETLKAWLRGSTTEQRLVMRARIILRLSEGGAVGACAEREMVSTLTVSKWRDRYLAQGIAGFQDAPRSGKPVTYGNKAEKRIPAELDAPPPDGYAPWNGTLLADALGDISSTQIRRVLRKHKITRERRHSWCICTDPKPPIQALERSQGWLKLPNGKAITGFSLNCKRHGTKTLLAALEVAAGLVRTGHYKRRR